MDSTFTLNGTSVTVAVTAGDRLIDMLRDRFGLAGTKQGCAAGECGSCTVLVDGRAINSCLMLAVQVTGAHVWTIEGLSSPAHLSLLQQRFVDLVAIQCGFCTPGMVMAATALLAVNPSPTPAQVRNALAGNLCRCTGFAAIVDAISAPAHAGDLPVALRRPGTSGEVPGDV